MKSLKQLEATVNRNFLLLSRHICSVGVCLLTTCSDMPDERSRGIYSLGADGEWPVAKFHSEPERGVITFYPASNADWQQLIDMTVFRGFRPGMTFRDALEEAGPPDSKGDGPLGPYWTYRRSTGDVRLSHEEMGSFFPRRWWILKWFPRSSSPRDIFHKNVAKEIPPDKLPMTIVIMNNEHHPGAFVQMSNGRVISIQWPNNPGSDSGST